MGQEKPTSSSFKGGQEERTLGTRERKNAGSFYVSVKLPTYPSLKGGQFPRNVK